MDNKTFSVLDKLIKIFSQKGNITLDEIQELKDYLIETNIVDSDEDGTIEWLDQVKDEYNLRYFVNPNLGKSLYGIGKAYDYCVEQSTTDIFMIFHADMMLGKDADLKAFNHLKPQTIVCATRIEPPLHPNNGEKILLDFGMYPEEFKKDEFNQYVDEHLEDNKTTNGIFAPWMMYKDEFLAMGGHDPILHSAREDSDVFNRMSLAGFTFIQPWNSLVYHLTGRGGQFQHGRITTLDSAKSEGIHVLRYLMLDLLGMQNVILSIYICIICWV